MVVNGLVGMDLGGGDCGLFLSTIKDFNLKEQGKSWKASVRIAGNYGKDFK
jgi:hypothetical protein